MTITDTLKRPLRDLRISVTDRCNFRCVYCMPKEIFGSDYQFLHRDRILTFEEIERLARIFVEHGVKKIRLTGGEPLVRKDLPLLISMLSSIPNLDLTLTTNGSLLARFARELKDAGLKRVSVSLDSLDNKIFKAMNDVDFPVEKVLEGMDAAVEAGLLPLKVNMVVKRGVNEASILPMAKHFREKGYILRFIEFMDVGHTNGWRMDDVIPAAEIVKMINAEMPLEPLDPNYKGEVAERWRYKDGSGEVGMITSVTQAFCGTCNRARLSAEGKLYTCLFAVKGHDFRDLLRAGATDDEISKRIERIWGARGDRYSELRSENTIPLPKVEMSHIGGWEILEVRLSATKQIKAILFDFDGTLRLDSKSGSDVFFARALEIGLSIDDETRLRSERWTHYYFANSAEIQSDQENFTGDEFWVNYSRRKLISLNCSNEEAESLSASMSAYMKENHKPHSHVLDESRKVLDALKKDGYILGVISNRDDPYHDELKDLNLESYFIFSLAGGEVQSFKPDTHIFDQGLKRAGVNADEAIYVGDNYYADIVGSRNAGLHPVLYDPDLLFPDAECAVIRSFNELHDLLK